MLASQEAAGASKPASPARTLEPVLGVGMLPARQKPQKLRGRDRLDLPAQALDGVTVNPRQQTAIAPGLAAVDARPQDHAGGFELREKRIVAEDRKSVV